MKMKRSLAILALFCASLAVAQTKTPLIQPHWVFFNQSGAACAGCSLYSYLAGTTMPTPTYTDASGLTQNTNPIVLGTDGGANIWVGTPTIKLALYDTNSTLIWTVDNIAPGGGGSSVCGPASTIQISNSTVTGLSCDALITISTVNHTINVGGALPSTHFTLTNLAPISASWTLDVSTPTTAALSIGGGTAAAGTYIDGGTGQWTALPASGTGTVTSVAATTTGTPLSVSGSPIISAGTFAFVLAVTGTEAKAVTAAAAGTSGNCAQWDSSGGVGDSGSPCGTSHVIQTAIKTSSFGSCPTAGTAWASCSFSVSWPIAFSTNAYVVNCSFPGGATALGMTNWWPSGKTTTAVTINIQNGDTSAANPISVSEADCTGTL